MPDTPDDQSTRPGEGRRLWRAGDDPGAYDERWARLAAAGENPHGEADLVMGYRPATVLDAGCGTGRVAIELARRGVDVVGTDLDERMLTTARTKAPEITWVGANLSALDLDRRFDLVVLAGNVVGFVEPDQRAGAVAACARHLMPAGRLVAGFSLRRDWFPLDDYDRWCAAAGLRLDERFATWDRAPFVPGGDYAVSVHRPADG